MKSDDESTKASNTSGGVTSSLLGSKWYAAALVLILAAIASQVLAKNHAGRGMMAAARRAAVPAERLNLRQIAHRHALRSGLWELASFGFAAVAVSSWVISLRRRERGSQGVLLVLHALFMLLLPLQV